MPVRKYPPFNWEESEKTRNPDYVAFLKSVHDKPISQQEYIDGWMALPHHAKRTGTTKPAKEYLYLRNKFGFFRELT